MITMKSADINIHTIRINTVLVIRQIPKDIVCHAIHDNRCQHLKLSIAPSCAKHTP